MICEYCGKIYYEKYGSGRFCCKVCSCAYVSNLNRKARNKKISESITKLILENPNACPGKKFSSGYDERRISNDELKKHHKLYLEKKRKDDFEYLISSDCNELSLSDKRKRKLIDVGYSCEICHITEWNGRPIKLHLHHIDGNHANNEYSNLQILCPNCHSQTETYCIGHSQLHRNIPKLTEEEIITEIKNSRSYNEILIKNNMKWPSYYRIKLIKEKMGLKFIDE